MKILFFCGSLENGKDGVGDYTRRLAGELIRQGHFASIVALNDRHLEKTEPNTTQKDLDTPIAICRIASKENWAKKIDIANDFVEKQNPDWLSLQFVPYSFQKKGLPFFLASRLKKIGGNRKWQIMFHELWIGMAVDSTTKDKWIGYIQKKTIGNLIKQLKPKVIHTQTTLYKKYLEKEFSVSVGFLPLFGNIPKVDGVCKLPTEEYYKMLLFGGIHPNPNLVEFLNWIKRQNKKMAIHFLGKNGKELDVWIEELKKRELKFVIYGVKSQKEISELLQNCDVGITTTPWLLIEKSGSVAAMLEHGLKVICASRKWETDDFFENEIQYQNLNTIKFSPSLTFDTLANNFEHKIDLKKLSKQFYLQLSENG